MWTPIRYAVLLLMLGVLTPSGCRPTAPPLTQVVATTAAALPSDPLDPGWQAAPEFVAKLLLQDLVEPRQMTETTPSLRVRTLTSASDVAFRLEWSDADDDNLPGAARFCDACAVQFPATIEPSVPAPQMGEAGRPVEITFWRAAWQATVDGRGDSITDLYPRATVDHYPFEARSLKKDSPAAREAALRYAPARALGNNLAGPRSTPVQDLIAEGPGTITPASAAVSKGCGRRTAEGWAVVITRPIPKGFSQQTPTQVAFAVWEGAHAEVGARKMRTGWIPFAMQVKP